MDIHTAAVDRNGHLEPGSSTALVPWWSFTKTLIAVCALRLAEGGSLALDEPLAELPYTPRDLLQHRAGVGNYGGCTAYNDAVARDEEPWPDDEVFARFPPDKLAFLPRRGWAYSNVGYLMMRRLIERAYGSGLRTVMQDLVLAPLGLHRSLIAETREDMRLTAFPGGQRYHPGWAFHGIVVGPVAEAALALHRLLTGDLLAPASRVALLDRHPIGGPITGRPWTTTGYGLGLMVGDMHMRGMARAIFVAGHSAGGPGSAGAVYHAAETGRSAAAFADTAGEDIPEYAALQRLITPGSA